MGLSGIAAAELHGRDLDCVCTSHVGSQTVGCKGSPWHQASIPFQPFRPFRPFHSTHRRVQGVLPASPRHQAHWGTFSYTVYIPSSNASEHRVAVVGWIRFQSSFRRKEDGSSLPPFAPSIFHCLGEAASSPLHLWTDHARAIPSPFSSSILFIFSSNKSLCQRFSSSF